MRGSPTAPRICEHCGLIFERPKSCGRPEWARRRFCSPACKAAAQIGKPHTIRRRRAATGGKRIPCRVCGQPTKYHGTEANRLFGLVHCGDPACAEESRRIKNASIAERARQMYASGQRRRIRGSWSTVPLVSAEERALSPWFESMGWTPQHKVLTGVHTNKLPRMFRLDFALPDRKLYVEIDGEIHQLRKERDQRRDLMLAGLGWSGLRIPAKVVRESADQARSTILRWVDESS